MPDDSCRTCGGDLVKHTRCSECRKIIQKMCTVCNLKTHKEFHPKCLGLDMYQVSNEKTFATAQTVVYKTPETRKNKKKHISNKILVLSGLVMISMTGLIFGNYLIPILPHEPTSTTNDEVRYTETKNQIQPTNVISNQGLDTVTHSSFKAQYANCLGISDGNNLAINCPTDYGIVYKAIVKIPDDLVLQFESKIFHMRNFSVLENSNDLLIEYQRQTYVTSFIVH